MRTEIEIKQLLLSRMESFIKAHENNLPEAAHVYQILIDELKWILNDNTKESNNA